MRKCACGCGVEILSTRANTKFAEHHSRVEKCKLRYRLSKAKACAGLLKPMEWRQCAICCEWFPVFRETDGLRAEIRTCPSYIKKGCNTKHRVNSKGSTYSKPKRKVSKQFRTTLCNKNNMPCAGYSACSDREFSGDPKKRRWDHEIHGKDCHH